MSPFVGQDRLDLAEAGGGSLRNLGFTGLDMFLHLTGEEA
jgi:hypothetical protein